MKIGIVGHGSIGSRHARNVAILGHETVIYDPLGPRDVKFERMVYEQCDAVVIATPTSHHIAGIRACAERGKHMLIEKPITLHDLGVAELLDLADSNSCVTMMGNNLRFHPCVQQARKLIRQAGDPLWAQFTCSYLPAGMSDDGKVKYSTDGVILGTGSHEVDIALHMFGPVKEVLSANTRGYTASGGLTDEIADFVIEHTSDVRSSFHLDFVTRTEIREAWIACEETNIGIDFLGRRTSLGSVNTGHGGSYDDDYLDEMKAFIDRINGKITPGASARDGLATLKVLLDVRRKAGLP